MLLNGSTSRIGDLQNFIDCQVRLNKFTHSTKWVTYVFEALGWLTGQEAVDAGITNLGLRDREFLLVLNVSDMLSRSTERLALRWIQTHIHAFGGDSSKVTM